MISFQNIGTCLSLKKESISVLIKNIVLEENKNIGHVSFIFCDDNYLLEKNKEFLNHDFFTDVISFDYSEKNTVSGDILISIDRVKENAKLFNVDFLSELHRVMIHGLLHLLKYNDKTKEEKRIMTQKENYYLNKICD